MAPKLWSSLSPKDPATVWQERIEQQENKSELQDGDIIFQVSQSAQCKAIQLATKSMYSHCGIIFKEEGQYFVYEAVQPVSKTPLKNWIARGENQHYVVKRLINNKEYLNEHNIAQMRAYCTKQLGKNYDMTFEWSDQEMYCSELVWKAYYKVIGLTISQQEQLKDFDLSHPIVKQKVVERYGNNIPLNEIVVAPITIYNSGILETVLEKKQATVKALFYHKYRNAQ